jgi:hypothetical protein
MISTERIKKAATLAFILLAFAGGFFIQNFYQRWRTAPKPPAPQSAPAPAAAPSAETAAVQPEVVEARDVDKIRTFAGGQARVHGRVFRVGKSSRSNTYFINFGPSRASFTAVIFPSSVPQFEQSQLAPKTFEGKEIEVTGEIKDHPQYGLEMILEDPAQVKILAD